MTKLKTRKTTDPVRNHIKELRIMELTFRCEAQTTISLGPDILKGNRFRGGLGYALRAVSCPMRASVPCGSCDRKEKCFYFLAFEIDKPHPYLIQPVFDGKETYGRGETFSFVLVLVGDGIPYVYRFIKAFERVGSSGIGRGQGRFSITDVFPLRLHKVSEFFPGRSAQRRRCTIRLLSPLSLEREGLGVYDTASPFPFSFFVRSIANRIVNLNNLFGDSTCYDREEIGGWVESLADFAESIRCGDGLSWFDGRRHSSRRPKPQRLEGFLGELSLSGDLKPLMPYLRIGELVGAGSNTTIGFGRFTLLDTPGNEQAGRSV